MTAQCRTCHAAVIWAQFRATGTKAPLDAEPVANGNLVITSWLTDGTAVIELYREPEPPADDTLLALLDGQPSTPAVRYLNHFATCPQRDQWRRR